MLIQSCTPLVLRPSQPEDIGEKMFHIPSLCFCVFIIFGRLTVMNICTRQLFVGAFVWTKNSHECQEQHVVALCSSPGAVEQFVVL